MFRNYLKLAFRNLTRQKAFSIINISGLAIGLASSLTIFLWVQDELSYDRFHTKADRTYRLTAAASDLEVAITPAPAGPAIREQVAGVEFATRLRNCSGIILQTGDKKFEETKVFYAEPSFFDVFDFTLAQGDPKTALAEPKNIVLTEATALRYFGTTDVLGKVLTLDNDDEFTVTGVVTKRDVNSHLQFDVLLPWALAASWDGNIKDNVWDSFNFYTYFVFDEPKNESSLADLQQQIGNIFIEHYKEVAATFDLQPLTDIHLDSPLMADVAGHGNFQYVAALSVVAIFIVLIGCINFMNLSTARSARRAKEVGLRKVAGAMRAQLIRQFLGESLLITTLSLIIALIAVALLLPVVNNLVGKQLHINFTDPLIMSGAVGITLITGVLSGIYPALVLSGFTPIKVLKKDVKGGAGGSVFRNVLVVAQFVISIVLLVGTTIVYQQLQYIDSKDIGYNKENLLYVRLHGDVSRNFNKWKAAFQAEPASANVTFDNDLPTNLASGTEAVTWQGKDPGKQILFAELWVDDNFIPVYDMKLASGRNFYKEMRGDTGNYILNETAAALMGFTAETAIGQPLETWEKKPGKIVGVLKDFNFKPLRERIEPMILRPNTWGGTVVVKAEAGKLRETIDAMERVWNSMENVYPFSYKFIDQDLENLYKSEKQVGTLFTVFAALAILISCLGLYGLSAYIAEQRTREIGIRKALGATISSIVYLLATRFVIPVLVAMIIAAPLAWYAMNQWLNGFAYKIAFNWLLVVAAGTLALVISLLTVSYESIRAAKVNPVKSLRTE